VHSIAEFLAEVEQCQCTGQVMARMARLILPGMAFHVVQRGAKEGLPNRAME
jgi:hypothetical protein